MIVESGLKPSYNNRSLVRDLFSTVLVWGGGGRGRGISPEVITHAEVLVLDALPALDGQLHVARLNTEVLGSTLAT